MGRKVPDRLTAWGDDLPGGQGRPEQGRRPGQSLDLDEQGVQEDLPVHVCG